jgi:hypothetical protein
MPISRLLVVLSVLIFAGCGRAIKEGTYAFEREENGTRVVHTYWFFSKMVVHEQLVKGEAQEKRKMVATVAPIKGGLSCKFIADDGTAYEDEVTATESADIIFSRHFGLNLKRWRDADFQTELVRGGFESGVDELKTQMSLFGWKIGDTVRVAYDIAQAPSKLNDLEAKIHLSFPGKSYTATATYAWQGERWSFVKGDLDHLDETFSRTLQDLPQFMPVRKR